MFDRWTRFAPLTGIVFVGLFIATFAVGGSTPGVHATGLKVISYYKAHHSGQKASDYLGVLGVVFLLFFAASLRTYLRLVETARALAVLGFAGVRDGVRLGGRAERSPAAVARVDRFRARRARRDTTRVHCLSRPHGLVAGCQHADLPALCTISRSRRGLGSTQRRDGEGLRACNGRIT